MADAFNRFKRGACMRHFSAFTICFLSLSGVLSAQKLHTSDTRMTGAKSKRKKESTTGCRSRFYFPRVVISNSTLTKKAKRLGGCVDTFAEVLQVGAFVYLPKRGRKHLPLARPTTLTTTPPPHSKSDDHHQHTNTTTTSTTTPPPPHHSTAGRNYHHLDTSP